MASKKLIKLSPNIIVTWKVTIPLLFLIIGVDGSVIWFLSLSFVDNPASFKFLCANIFSSDGNSSTRRAINCCILNKFPKIFLPPLRLRAERINVLQTCSYKTLWPRYRDSTWRISFFTKNMWYQWYIVVYHFKVISRINKLLSFLNVLI